MKKFSKVFATDYFACSEKAGRWLFGDKTYENGNVIVIKNAIDYKKFSISESEAEHLRNTLKLSDNIVIGHVGRFTYAKNHMKLLEIFSKIIQRKPNAKLLLVGDGELKNDIEKRIIELGLKNAVVLVGKVFNPEKYYSVMDVVILPSIFEGFSMTAIETQISGIPLLLSKAVPNEAIISDGCIYMDLNEDSEKWADKAIQLLRKKVTLANNSTLFDIHKCSKSLEKWYLERYGRTTYE